MAIDKSLKGKGGLVRSRNVLKREERVEQMKSEEKWKEGQSALGLPKTRVMKISGKKKVKKKEEAGDAAGKAAGKGAGKAEVAVEDDGPGMPPDKLTAVFERFYSLRPENEPFGMHSGLGLSISKQIVEAHGGRLWAENRTGAELNEDGAPKVLGARFTVRLPAM